MTDNTNTRAPTDAGGAVSEAAGDLALSLRVVRGRVIGASTFAEVMVPRDHLRRVLAALSSPQPLQQGGEVTREQVAKVLFDRGRHTTDFQTWDEDPETRDWMLGHADAILALFATLAADRDKAVGLLRRSSDDLHAELLARYGDDHAHYPGIRRKFDADMEIVNEARAFLSRQKRPTP